MKLRTRAFAAIFATALLFTQLAVSAFACPGEGGMPAASHSPMEAMSGCDESGAAPSPLCPAHCAQGSQSLDKPASPQIPPPVLLGFATWRALDVSFASIPIAARLPHLIPPADPPPALRNCCLRI